MVLATAATALAATAGQLAVAAPAAVPSSNLTAYLHGKRLPDDPLLHRHDAVRVVVRGFAQRVAVVVRLGGAAHGSTRWSGPSGVVDVTYSVPAGLANGEYLLTIVGPAGGDPSQTRVADGAGDGVVVTVPNGGFFPFHVGDAGNPASSSGSSGGVGGSETAVSSSPGGHGGGSGNGSGNGSGVDGNGLSSTGARIGGPLLAAFCALVVGVVAVRLGRQPRRH
ncbi:MAG: hypothetical protein QOE97_2969 [Pseudonocardiales bacterium]|nr:hypothetical protein [Pseudonocardiales bacterium]